MRGVFQDILHVQISVLEVGQKLFLPVLAIDELLSDHKGSPDEVIYLALYM